MFEKSEFVKSIAVKRDNGKEAWLVRKRKRGAEEEIAARQRKSWLSFATRRQAGS